MEIDEEERNALVNVNFFAQNVNIIHISMFKTLPYGSVFFVLNLHLENL